MPTRRIDTELPRYHQFMSRYRRSIVPGGTFFFTVVTYRRLPWLTDPLARGALREAISRCRLTRPFEIDAWVLLPDHLHAIWTLPADDADYSTRWAQIKRTTSVLPNANKRSEWLISSKQKHRESTLWQRRFFEHTIRDDADFERCVDYVHWNPVKHAHAESVSQWPWSTFHRYAARGEHSHDLGGVAQE